MKGEIGDFNLNSHKEIVSVNMQDDPYGISSLQHKMLDILKVFISFCEDHDLQYWAGGGTCLGALRHQGFIPWDDDLDVFMPRPDYEMFWEIWNTESSDSQYKLCRTGKSNNYHHRVMQLVDCKTTFINLRNVQEDIEHGVYIDIIPMDAAATHFIPRLYQIYYAITFSVFNIQCLPELQGGKLMRLAVAAFLRLIQKKETRYRIWRRAEEKMTHVKWDNAEYAVELTTSFKSLKRLWPRKWFRVKKAPFEDIMINIPSGAEEYMSAIYGDYMQLPPVEERKVRHNTVFIDLEHSYLDYKGKYYCTKQL